MQKFGLKPSYLSLVAKIGLQYIYIFFFFFLPNQISKKTYSVCSHLCVCVCVCCSIPQRETFYNLFNE